MVPVAEYKTLRSQDSTALDGLINTALKEGFELYGSPYSVGDWMCQAVLKYKEPEQPAHRGFTPVSTK